MGRRVSAIIKCHLGYIKEGYSRIEAGMCLGIFNVDLNNVRVGLHLGVNVQNAIAMNWIHLHLLYNRVHGICRTASLLSNV
jgi:hypothetical protein